MSDKPCRAWFQIHLSTGVVLIFLASHASYGEDALKSGKDENFDIKKDRVKYAIFFRKEGELGRTWTLSGRNIKYLSKLGDDAAKTLLAMEPDDDPADRNACILLIWMFDNYL